MSVIHATTVRNGICANVLAQIDSGGGAGKLAMLTAGSVVVATLNFSATSFGAAASGTATANAIAKVTRCMFDY